MARYLLVVIDDNAQAESLRLKLNGWAGFDVIGMFAKPTKFCVCEDYAGVAPRDRNLGWRVHAKCKLPRENETQQPNNLLQRGIASRFQHMHLSLREPYKTPVERYGQKMLDHYATEFALIRKKLKQRAARARR